MYRYEAAILAVFWSVFFFDPFSYAVCSNLSSINAMILHLAAVLMILYNHTHLQCYALLSECHVYLHTCYLVSMVSKGHLINVILQCLLCVALFSSVNFV